MNGQSVGVVHNFKYLGLTFDSKQFFIRHTTSTQRKSQQRLCFLRRLNLFHLQPKLLLNLYRSIIKPIFTYCGMIFLPSVSVSQKNKFLKIANTTSKITGLPVPSLSEVTDRAVLRKARSISVDSSHPLYDEFELLLSARRFRTMKSVNNRFE